MNIARAGALTLATVLAVLAPTAAEAKSYVRNDTSNDVVQIDQKSGSSTKVPDHADGDIVRSAVAHGKGRVAVALSYRDLAKPATNSADVHFFRIGTNKKRIRTLIVVASSSRPQGVIDFEKANGKSVKCRGLRWKIDYTAKTVRASVPRRCLGNPKWVHVGMAGVTENQTTAFADDAGTNGYLGQQVKWGPRVYR